MGICQKNRCRVIDSYESKFITDNVMTTAIELFFIISIPIETAVAIES